MPIIDLLYLSVQQIKREFRDTRDRIGNEDQEDHGTQTNIITIVHTKNRGASPKSGHLCLKLGFICYEIIQKNYLAPGNFAKENFYEIHIFVLKFVLNDSKSITKIVF